MSQDNILKVSDRLRSITSVSHQKLEKEVIGLIGSLRTSDDYAHLLGLFYGYFTGVESLIEAQNLSGFLPDINERRKVNSIGNDLSGFGIPQPVITGKNDLPVIVNPFQAMGALYVIEGSTLGGVYIIKMIQKKLSGNQHTFHFFSGYGDRNPLMWDRFKKALDNAPSCEDDTNFIISGAEDTFEKFYEWIKAN